jgi:diguanylate cyclase
MTSLKLDRSVRTWWQVVGLTVAGTLLCILVALAIDSFSFTDWTFRWGNSPLNNIIIPLVLAPPFFFVLLSKMRALSIAHEQLEIVASTDGLTECMTRRAFTTLVEAYLEKVEQERNPRGGALLVIDVDDFKTVNDRFGHDCGDEALKTIAATIKSSLREVDLVGRMGGEEFSVFLPGAAAEVAQRVAERIRSTIQQTPFEPHGTRVKLSVSVGGTTFREPTDFSQLYREADQQLYEAKRSGRNRVLFGSPQGSGKSYASSALH